MLFIFSQISVTIALLSITLTYFASEHSVVPDSCDLHLLSHGLPVAESGLKLKSMYTIIVPRAPQNPNGTVGGQGVKESLKYIS